MNITAGKLPAVNYAYSAFKRDMEIKSVRNSATGIADQRPYSPNLTGKIVRNKINNANERKNVTVIADQCHILSWN